MISRIMFHSRCLNILIQMGDLYKVVTTKSVQQGHRVLHYDLTAFKYNAGAHLGGYYCTGTACWYYGYTTSSKVIELIYWNIIKYMKNTICVHDNRKI